VDTFFEFGVVEVFVYCAGFTVRFILLSAVLVRDYDDML